LGVEGLDFAERPIEIKGLRGINVKSVSCGYEHSLALSVDGEVFSWGQGEGGLLGHKDQIKRSVPKKIDFFN
jgi:alpha-tubulin suppressor-like RCC1 family protein